MSGQLIPIEALVFVAIFTILFFASSGERKYSVANVHNYPPDIQEEYFRTHERVDVSYQSKNDVAIKGLGIAFSCGALCVLPPCGDADLLAGVLAHLRPHGVDWAVRHALSRLRVLRQHAPLPPRGHGAHGRLLPPEVVPPQGEWNMELLPYGDGDGYEARLSHCGICTLMAELGLSDLVSVMCRLDYAMSEGGASS